MVKQIAGKARSFFQKKQTTLFSAAFVIMVTVAASRVLGLVRDRMLAARFTTDDLGIYFAAFRLPNLLFELLVMGALSTAFIPVISGLLAKEDSEETFHVASSVINISTIIFSVISAVLFILSKSVAKLIAPGFNDSQLIQLSTFTRIMLIGQVAPLLIGNFLTGILQSYRLFIIPSLAPVVYNLGIIGAIIFLTPVLGLYAPVWGVVIGAFLFMIIQIPLVYSLGYRHRFAVDYKNKEVRTIGKLMLPRTFGMAISQIDTTVDLILSSLLGARNVTIFNFAQHLQLVPIGFFGVPIATAALPSLSATFAKENKEEFNSLFIHATHQIFFFVLPASVMLIVLRIPIVRLVFGAERFDWQATVLTGKTLSAFSISLFAQSFIHLLTRAFFSFHDSKTPVIVGVFSILLNTLMSVFFISYLKLPVWGLGLSASIASIFNAFLLFLILSKKIKALDIRKLLIPIGKMSIATLITGIALYIPMKLLDQLIFDTTKTVNLIFLTLVVSLIGLTVYAFLSWLLGLEQVIHFANFARKAVKVKQLFIETPTEVMSGEVTHPSQ